MRQEKLMTSDVNRKKYREFFEGKRVVFAGPGSIMKGRGLGGWIDSFDIVVRTNNLPVVIDENKKLSEDIGSRTDVLYMNHQYYKSTYPLPFELYKRLELKWLCMKRCKPIDFRVLRKICSVRLFRRESVYLSKYIDVPLTGMVIAYDILKNDPAELCFTGIDFYLDACLKSIRGDDPKTYQSYIDESYISDNVKKENKRRGIGEGKGHDVIPNAAYLKRLLDEGLVTMPDFIEERLTEVLS